MIATCRKHHHHQQPPYPKASSQRAIRCAPTMKAEHNTVVHTAPAHHRCAHHAGQHALAGQPHTSSITAGCPANTTQLIHPLADAVMQLCLWQITSEMGTTQPKAESPTTTEAICCNSKSGRCSWTTACESAAYGAFNHAMLNQFVFKFSGALSTPAKQSSTLTMAGHGSSPTIQLFRRCIHWW
jgi:hypothetical protein